MGVFPVKTAAVLFSLPITLQEVSILQQFNCIPLDCSKSLVGIINFKLEECKHCGGGALRADVQTAYKLKFYRQTHKWGAPATPN